ncbi:efflux RND transporter periplasmic adaptor subunit [Sinorhizobium numidicum]|uniref:Efflux RND transporter periplasmic adaptor subunit n=1 Tax=Sinorhizobium numidicum TaxID=680248 RepID=A0ABY8CY85_9HYPH|nr:efflux RND transporter periplasmic adaptor subunit [Sinorhizobium numidicum]WEX76956.1 efflux RND transporter periplasmic adaptor subunit [Sinorhizobium numidicum]WEX83615.1 efflux RND transporter periplasmic adaptor subunit [Sinorhizobium numidicum]
MLRNWRLPAILGVSTFLLISVPADAQDAQLPTVTVAKPVVRDVIDADEFIGRFEAVDEVSVRSRVGGYLDEVLFTDGALVKKGDKLFVIDQRPFRTALAQAEASLASAQSTLAFAETTFKRTESLAGTGTLSVSRLDDDRRALLAAQAGVRGAEAAVERAKLDLEYTTITAPLSGRVDRRLLSPGNLVQADQTVLTTIVTLDPIDFYFDVDERRLLSYARTARERGSALQEGAGALSVLVTIADANEAPFEGKLDFAENRVDNQTGTMRVRARFPNPNFILQPGLFGRVEVEGSNIYRAVLVPDEAIGADQNERIVYEVSQDGSVMAKPVRLGPRLHGYRVIRSGMTGDETIIVNGLMRARPGVKVKPELVVLPQEAAQSAENAQ